VPDTFEQIKAALANHYEVVRLLGSGGMATVYLAQDLKHRRQVAVKVLRPELAAAIGPERFLREIDVAAALQHPHILPLYDSGEADGLLYYVMPYVEGESLRDRLMREKQLPVEDALQVAREVALGLSHAHSHGVVHRDIKPENILLSGGTAVIADFGIAHAITEAGGERITETGIAVGTPTYMSPEQAAGERDLDGRSDVYSLGCVLFEMLGGEAPFTGPTVESIVRQHLTADAPQVTALRPTVPGDVAHTLSRSLAKAPADRQATALAFAEELRAEIVTPTSGTIVVAAASPRRMAALFVGGTVVALMVVYGLVLLLGLPDWVFLGALALTALAVPVILVTGHAEQRRAAPHGGRDEGVRRWFTWRRALLGGAAAFGGLAVIAGGYMTMRALGIGPVGTLMAAGVLEERDRIVLAGFVDHTGDSTLAMAVTQAIRIDLDQSPVVRLVSPGEMAEALRRMGRSPSTPLPLSVAGELALREGVKAVLAGEINAAGTGYLLSAQLVAAESNEVLTSARETARDPTSLVPAIDRLSARLRERIGESLRSIRRSPSLSRVTTTSLAALRHYSEALVLSDQGHEDRAIPFLEEAIHLDTAFAMAYRKLGMVLGNQLIGRARAMEMHAKAYEHRDRLTERERYMTMAAYFDNVTGEPDRAIAAYEAILLTDPDDSWALNNLGVLAGERRDYRKAAEAYRRATAVDSANNLSITNLAFSLINLGEFAEAAAALDVAARRFPEDFSVPERRAQLAYAQGEYDRAFAIMDSLHNQTPSAYVRFRSGLILKLGAGLRGRVSEADRLAARALAFVDRAGLGADYLRFTARDAQYDIVVRGSEERALERLQAALDRFPLESIDPAARPYPILAEVFALAGDTRRARELLEEFQAEVDPVYRRAAEGDRRRALGYLALEEGRPRDAIMEFELSDAELGRRHLALHGLGLALEMAGEVDSAVAVFERFVDTPSSTRLFPDALWLPSVYEHLGELHERLGDPERAAHYYNALVELWSNADAELQPVVDDVRARIARLVGEPRS
jgi:tetratricopeptide (TPR) repeat protein/tRNA A-37 threonylcarbamoyl transferase component Bud32